MDIRKLRYFMSVVEAGSFTRAAAQLHVAQSALSLHVRQLEERYGTLLIRDKRGVRPTDRGAKLLSHAAKILRRLSGRVHEVCSSVFICHLASTRSTSFHEISQVRFRRLNEEEIDNYLAQVNPLDKAGSYAAQGGGATVIARIEGSFSNVVGLPMEKTAAALAAFGIRPKPA